MTAPSYKLVFDDVKRTAILARLNIDYLPVTTLQPQPAPEGLMSQPVFYVDLARLSVTKIKKLINEMATPERPRLAIIRGIRTFGLFVSAADCTVFSDVGNAVECVMTWEVDS